MSITTVVHNNIGCSSDNFGTSHVRVVVKTFQLAKSKIHQKWTIVCWHNDTSDWTQRRKEEWSLEMCGACYYLDAFPQSMANSSSIVGCFMH